MIKKRPGPLVGWKQKLEIQNKKDKNQLIKAFPKARTLAAACRETGVKYSSAMNWKHNDIEFAERLNIAQEEVADDVEEAIIKRAAEGIEEYHLSQGLPVPDPENEGQYLRRRVYSNKLAEFYLKSRRREVFGERKEISGPGGGAINVQLYIPSNERSRDAVNTKKLKEKNEINENNEDIVDAEIVK